MRSSSVVVFAAAAVVALVQGQDECMPPKPGEKHSHPPECCKLAGQAGIIPDSMKTGMDKCKLKFPHPPRPAGPPPDGVPPTPTPEMKNNHACMAECIFTEAGLVKEKALDKAAILKAFVPDNEDLAAVVSAAVEKCFSSYKSEIDDSHECKSGAAEFKMCVMREVFLNCPSSLWTDSTDCTNLKTKITNCPMLPVMFGLHGPHGSRPN